MRRGRTVTAPLPLVDLPSVDPGPENVPSVDPGPENVPLVDPGPESVPLGGLGPEGVLAAAREGVP